MNPWDFIDNLEFAGTKISTFVKRTIFFSMIAFPAFGSWMITQAVHREQQAVIPLAVAYRASLTQMLAWPALRLAPVLLVNPSEAKPMVLYPSRYKGPDVYGVRQGK